MKSKPEAVKKIIIIAIAVVALAATIWLCRPAYHHWKERRLVASAQKALATDDPKLASLAARQALAINPSNIVATRVMATLADQSHAPVAVQWRQRLVELQPQSVTNKLDLARSAIVFGNFPLAARTLQTISETNRNSSEFHQLAAMIAVSLNNFSVAEAHFSEALKLDPTNKIVELNRAVLRLQAKDEQVVSNAVQTLETLVADPQYRKDALRHLAMAASREKDFEKAIRLTRELQADASASLDDQLMHLGALKDGADEEFKNYLATLESNCSTNAARASVLASWLIAHDMGDTATNWVDGLSAEVKTSRPVVMAKVNYLIAQNDWARLQALLAERNWDDADHLRHALLARANREQGGDFSSQSEWRAAALAAQGQVRKLTELATIAEKWKWTKEQEDLLWTIAERFPAERWAVQSLNELCYAAGNTRALLRLFALQVNNNPEDLAAKNNLAAVSLLLDAQPAKAAELAREVYTRYPSNESFASTEAFALLKQGNTNEALIVFSKLSPTQLERPSVALYYAAVLVANNEMEKARTFLQIAESGQLLPEEKTLLAGLKARL